MHKKLLLFLLFFIGIWIFFPPNIFADGEFLIDPTVDYKIGTEGVTSVTHTITIENVYSTLYATSYSLTLENIDPQNVRAFQDSRSLEISEDREKERVTLTVNFDDAVVGRGKTRTFSISFDESTFATKTGEVWEITIPRISNPDSFRNYYVNLYVPTSFGQEAYISPDANSSSVIEGFRIYSFNKEAIARTGITAGFGEFQVFTFNLNYHVENPLNKAAYVEIALPPDTAFQKLYYNEINQEPLNVRVDEDGNWLANYYLRPRERLDIVANGAVQIFSSERPFLAPSHEALETNRKESAYWQVSDFQVRQLAQSLGSPKAIYDYITTNLSYDYSRVKPNVERLGAKAALASPQNAICMEYTDLFIALTRAVGIPAREVNGFAYTENPEIQPLSLVADVLHAWPEYWSDQRNAWIPVDPTWGSTSGVDYFDKLDLRHFTFVVHGQDPNKPYPPGSYKLGPNPQKDVFVTFGQLPSQKTSHPEIVFEMKNSFPFAAGRLIAKVKNPGPVALYNEPILVSFDNATVESAIIEVLPPYAVYEKEISVPFTFLGRKTPDQVSVSVSDTLAKTSAFKNQVIIYNLLALSVLLAIIIVFILTFFGKIQLKGIKDRIRRLIKTKDENVNYDSQISKTTDHEKKV